uniref:Uncharacterized protein n=1 Tax=Rhipicephalus pulchellus TaxID=72859 RepID=L7M0E0_RHIPC
MSFFISFALFVSLAFLSLYLSLPLSFYFFLSLSASISLLYFNLALCFFYLFLVSCSLSLCLFQCHVFFFVVFIPLISVIFSLSFYRSLSFSSFTCSTSPSRVFARTCCTP